MRLDPQRAKVRFADFEVNLHSGELQRRGTRVRLSVQPLRVLTLLLEHAQQLVSREELHRLLWPGKTFVDFEHGINKTIAKLRYALHPLNLIETFPRRGYRFAVPVEWIAEDPIRSGDEARCFDEISPGVATDAHDASAEHAATQNIVAIEPDLVDTFPDAASVNQALRSLKEIATRSALDRTPRNTNRLIA